MFVPHLCLACSQLGIVYLSHRIVPSRYLHSQFRSSHTLLSYVKDNYLDAYLRVIMNTDPLKTSLVFSCGMGAVRTTFAMAAACLVRRRQLMLRGIPDPFAPKMLNTPSISHSASGMNTVSTDSSI